MSTRLYTLLCVLLLSAAVAMAQAPSAQQSPGQQGYPQQNPGMGRPGAGDPGLPGGQQGQQMPSDSTAQAPSQTVPRVDDSALTQKVQDQLASNPSMKNVQATVSNGVVNLDGSVANKADKKEVKKMVQSIPGVRGVKDHLQIAAPPSTSSNKMFGESISAAQATTAQPEQQNPSSAPSTTTPPEASPTTQNPTTPSTTTPPEASPTQTPSSAPSTPQQTPTQPATPEQPGSTSGQATGTTGMEAGAGSDQGLQGQINTALKNEPSLASDTVSANVTFDSIVLSGNVASEKEHKTAKRIAQSFTNNKKLVDNITVGAPH